MAEASSAVSATEYEASVAQRSSFNIKAVAAACLLMSCATTAYGQVEASEPPVGTQSAAFSVPLDHIPVWVDYRPRVSIIHSTGDGVGYRNGFTSLESFVPLFGSEGSSLIFADARALFDSDGVRGANLGVGRRLVIDDEGSVLGMHVYYDQRDLGRNHFRQISPGLSLNTETWELNLNGYLTTPFDERQAVPNRFGGNHLFVDRFETAMSGVDAELGIPLPVTETERFNPKVFAGWYGFYADHRPSVNGFRARLNASVSDRLGVGLSIQHDEMFGTTTNFNVAFRFSSSALLQRPRSDGLLRSLVTAPEHPSRRQRLVAPVGRFSNIVVDQSEETLAVNPTTGQPIVFSHVAPGGNSNGSFASPYATLNAALDDSSHRNGDVDFIYVRGAGSPTPITTHTGAVNPADGTKLISDGPIQKIATQVGDRVLPFSGADVALNRLPKIVGRVNLGNDSSVEGFEITAPSGDTAVVGTGIENPVIRSNVINFPMDGNGIRLDQISEFLLLSGNRLQGAGENASLATTSYVGSAVLIQDSLNVTGTISNNSVTMSSGDGVAMVNSVFHGTFSGNELNDNRYGLRVSHPDSSKSSSIDATIMENRIVGNRVAGIFFESTSIAASTMVSDNVIDQNVMSGVDVFESVFAGAITSNTITGSFLGQPPPPAELSRIFDVDTSTNRVTLNLPDISELLAGIRVRGGVLTGDIFGNQMNDNVFGGILIDKVGAIGSAGDRINVSGNTVTDSLFGILVDGNGPAYFADVNSNTVQAGDSRGPTFGIGLFNEGRTINSNVSDNSAVGATYIGLNIVSNDFNGNLTGNIADNNAAAGIEIFLKNSFAGDISDNTTNGNGLVAPIHSGGIRIDAPGGFTGNVQNNTANNNGEDSGLFWGVGSFTGNFEGNTANDNQEAGITLVADIVTGNFRNNTANNNQQLNTAFPSPGVLLLVDQFDGNISDNTVSNNLSKGIDILGLSSGLTLNGDISGNTANNNAEFGINIRALSLTGDISGNTTSNNGGGAGLFGRTGLSIATTDFTGAVSGNTAVNNSLSEGLSLSVATSGTADVDFLNNNFQGNNFGQREALFTFTGSGTLDLTLQDNTSTNTPADGINFDLLNSGGGSFNVTPSGINGVNTGTVGSSDASVTIP